MYSIRLLSRIDLISSIVGGLICIVFVYYEGTNPERETSFPWEQTIGMAFNAITCPIIMYLNFDFYERWRNIIITVLRLSFIAGTTADYEDIPHQVFPWPSFIVNLLYFSRSLVIGWGCFGWLLPMKYHLIMQALHSILALRLAPVTCRSSSSAGGETFASLNMDKFRAMMNMLDWPFRLMSGSPKRILDDLTTDSSACLSVNVWLTLVFGFILPSFALFTRYPGLGLRLRLWIERDGMFLLVCAIQALWCILRIATIQILQQ